LRIISIIATVDGLHCGGSGISSQRSNGPAWRKYGIRAGKESPSARMNCRFQKIACAIDAKPVRRFDIGGPARPTLRQRCQLMDHVCGMSRTDSRNHSLAIQGVRDNYRSAHAFQVVLSARRPGHRSDRMSGGN
jgi:hypothetical protein